MVRTRWVNSSHFQAYPSHFSRWRLHFADTDFLLQYLFTCHALLYLPPPSLTLTVLIPQVGILSYLQVSPSMDFPEHIRLHLCQPSLSCHCTPCMHWLIEHYFTWLFSTCFIWFLWKRLRLHIGKVFESIIVAWQIFNWWFYYSCVYLWVTMALCRLNGVKGFANKT